MEINKNNDLVENTTGPNAPNIATADNNLSVDVMFQQSQLPSLGRQIFSVVPINGPIGGLFNIKKKANTVAQAQVNTATPIAANSTTYTLTINGINYSYTSGIGATVAQITAGLTLEINITQTNGIVPVTAVDNNTSITLTADVPGTPFTVSSTGAGTINLVLTTPNIAAAVNNYFELVRKEVSVLPTTAINTGITKEVIQDVYAQYGKEVEQILGKLLRGLANDQENAATLSFLNTNSLAGANLQLTNSLNAETNLFEITQRVHEIVLKINSKNLRTYEAFAVIPFQALAGIMGLSQYVGAHDKEIRGLFIAQVGQTKFFVNPDATSTTAYVGVRDSDNPSKSSAIFSPYQSQIVESQDNESGNYVYNIYNRFAITASPLHELNNEMLHKFTILL